MKFGKLTSLVIVWGMMMNIFHPLSHALTADVSSSLSAPISTVLSGLDISTDHEISSKVHHKEDLGKGHCDTCHISVTAFIIGQDSSEVGIMDTKQGLFSVVIPAGYLSLGLDQPPQILA